MEIHFLRFLIFLFFAFFPGGGGWELSRYSLTFDLPLSGGFIDRTNSEIFQLIDTNPSQKCIHELSGLMGGLFSEFTGN